MEDFTTEKLTEIKKTIEQMEKYHQIEILKIFIENQAKVNENKSGVFINMSLLNTEILQKVLKYIDYVKEQNICLNNIENEKEKYKTEFFSGGGSDTA